MADNQINIVISATDNASKVLTAVSKGVDLISGAVKNLVGPFQEYGAQVKQLASYTGATSEETSRLIQVADDAGISYETLAMAAKSLTMENAQAVQQTAKLQDQISKLQAQMANGKATEEMQAQLAELQSQMKEISPTANLGIESLARMSDEYIKLKDPVQQAIFLQKNFSRSGQDLAKLMLLGGDAIRENAKAISDSLIIDEEKARRIEFTRVALDNFNDQIQGMKFEIADRLLGIFEAMPQPIRDATLAVGALLSPTNINSLIQFGILLKGVNFSIIANGAAYAVKWVGAFAALLVEGGLAGGIAGIGAAFSAAVPGLSAFAVAAWAVVAPIAAATLAVAALVELFRMDETKQALALLWGKIGETVTGDKSRGAAATLAAYQNLGGGQQSLINDTTTGEMLRGFLTPRARGGPVAAGGAYWVGENGPEPFIPSMSGNIIPSGAMIGGNTIVFNYQPFISTADQMQATQALTPIIQQAIRTQTGRGR